MSYQTAIQAATTEKKYVFQIIVAGPDGTAKNVTLFLDKLTSLNRTQGMVPGDGTFSRAYDAVSEIAAPAALEKVERI